jgi:hypothetical protein
MTPSPNNEEKLERLIHRTLRELPPRRAPDSLQQRVFAEVQRRINLPWWRKSFAHWPGAAKAAFILLSAGAVQLLLMLNGWVKVGVDTSPYKQAVSQQFSWVESGLAIVHAIGGFFEVLFRNIPPLWLYGGLAFFATMYLALFGLGAAAYKVIHTRH